MYGMFRSIDSAEKSVIFNYWLLYTRKIWNRNTILWESFIIYLLSDFFLDEKCNVIRENILE